MIRTNAIAFVVILAASALSGATLAESPFPPGTTYVLSPSDPVTARVEDIPLWPGVAPGSENLDLQEVVEVSTVNPSRNVRGVLKPMMQAFVATKPGGVSVLVMPGGGYRNLVWDKEGVEIARWLNGVGIDAYVLKYRLPSEGHRNGRFVPLQDSQRAMRLIRSRQPAAKVGALGFSAGGHLAGVIGTTYDTKYYEALDRADALSPRPDFLVLVYAPAGGGMVFPGAEERVQLVARYSIVTGIDTTTPPTFIAQGAADSKVPARNAEQIFSALQKAGVAAEVHIFPGAEHGFALRTTGPEKEWPTLCAAWLSKIGMLPAEIRSPGTKRTE